MKETFAIWRTIFSRPAEGYGLIQPTTNILVPVLFLVLVAVVSGLLTLPMVAHPAYWGAYSRATLNFAERFDAFREPGSRAAQEKLLADPGTHSIALFAAVLTPPLNLVFALAGSAILLWLVSLILRGRVPFGVMLRLLAFTWFVPAWAGLLKNLLFLFSGDYQALFGRVNTLLEFNATQTAPFSLAVLFPPGSVSLPLIYAIDFFTNVFHVIFYALLFIGLRTLGLDNRAWKAGVLAGVFLAVHFTPGFLVFLLMI